MLIFETDFEESEVIEYFQKWCTEEFAKRIIKRGKLFEISYSNNSLLFAHNHLMSGSGPCWMSPFEWDKIEKKYERTVSKCIKLLKEMCKEENAFFREEATDGVAKRLIVYR